MCSTNKKLLVIILRCKSHEKESYRVPKVNFIFSSFAFARQAQLAGLPSKVFVLHVKQACAVNLKTWDYSLLILEKADSAIGRHAHSIDLQFVWGVKKIETWCFWSADLGNDRHLHRCHTHILCVAAMTPAMDNNFLHGGVICMISSGLM